MACVTPLSQSQPLCENTQFTVLKKPKNQVCSILFSRITRSSNLCEFGVVKKPKNQFLEIPFSRITQSSSLCQFGVVKKPKNQVCAIPFSRITQSSNLCEFGVVKKPKNQFLEIPFSRITQSSSLCQFGVVKKPKNQVCAIPFSRITQRSNLCEFGVVNKPKNPVCAISFSRITQSSNLCGFGVVKRPKNQFCEIPLSRFTQSSRMALVSATTTAEKSNKKYPGEAKGFVEEMRFVAMKLHTKDQAKEGEKEAEGQPLAKWEPTVEGYLKFLVDSKLVYDTLEKIVEKAPFPEYAEFRNTGLERSEVLAKDLEWFRQQGHAIPEPSTPGVSYARYLEELLEKDPQAFIFHFYNTYFAFSWRSHDREKAENIVDKKELEFYKWDGDLSQLLQNVRDKLNKVAENWTREEKNHCLEETEKSFKFSGAIPRLIVY